MLYDTIAEAQRACASQGAIATANASQTTTECRISGREANLMSKVSYYEALGLSSGASEEEIKSAYKRLAKEWHPDLNSDPHAPEKFRSCAEAYRVLSDPALRRIYDVKLGSESIAGMDKLQRARADTVSQAHIKEYFRLRRQALERPKFGFHGALLLFSVPVVFLVSPSSHSMSSLPTRLTCAVCYAAVRAAEQSRKVSVVCCLRSARCSCLVFPASQSGSCFSLSPCAH